MATPEKSKEQQMKDFINAVGMMSEMALVFYRSTRQAGATTDEATRLTQAFIAASLYGNTGSKQPE